MATIKGKWVFNESIVDAQAVSQNVSFSSNTIPYSTMYVSLSSMAGTPVLHYDGEIVFDLMGFDADFRGWKGDTYRTVDFGTTEQTVSDTFLTWMQANATPEAEPTPTDAVTIEYNGAIIASLKAGQSATLPCKDKPMHTDVVVSVPDGMGAGEVIEEWDGSYTVSGGTISFTIDGVSYEAEDGMTWAEWCDSSYNTGGYSIGYADGIYGFVVNEDDMVVVNDAMNTEAITNGKAYATYAAGPA